MNAHGALGGTLSNLVCILLTLLLFFLIFICIAFLCPKAERLLRRMFPVIMSPPPQIQVHIESVKTVVVVCDLALWKRAVEGSAWVDRIVSAVDAVEDIDGYGVDDTKLEY